MGKCLFKCSFDYFFLKCICLCYTKFFVVVYSSININVHTNLRIQWSFSGIYWLYILICSLPKFNKREKINILVFLQFWERPSLWHTLWWRFEQIRNKLLIFQLKNDTLVRFNHNAFFKDTILSNITNICEF